MDKRVIWTKKARAIFDEITLYLEYEFSEKTSQKFVNNVKKCLTRIGKYPESGQNSTRRKGAKFVRIDKHRILYYKIKDDVVIIFLFDTRQNPNKNPYR